MKGTDAYKQIREMMAELPEEEREITLTQMEEGGF